MPMRSWWMIAITTLLLPVAAVAGSRAPDAPPDPPPDHPRLFDQVESFRLDNGMLFLLLSRRDVPMISGTIVVKVGNVDNPPGATGLAHMFEHMAFKGTDRIGTRDAAAERAVLDSISVAGDELTRLLRGDAEADSLAVARLRGGIAALEERAAAHVIPMEFPRVYDGYTYDFNAYTNHDFTVYVATLPANNLEVWMLMESERLQNPVFREFYAELAVVKEERRQVLEDSPEAMARELLKSQAFSTHPYRYPVIGYMDDLETLSPAQSVSFWRDYYAPDNMVAALVGDFDIDEAKAMIEDYFGDLSTRPTKGGPTVVEPAQTGTRRGVHRQGEERRLLMAFPGFGPGDPRRYAADLLSSVLTRDKTSRLVRRLDLEEGVARNVSSSSTGGYQRYAGLFTITVDLLENADNAGVEALVWEELDRLQAEPVTQDKLDEIRASYRKGFVFQLQTNGDLASLLARTQASHGDWRRVYGRFEDYDRVTVAEVTALAGDLFRREKLSVVHLEPDVPDDAGSETGGGS